MTEDALTELPHSTERTRAWRQKQVPADDLQCIEDIEEFGSHLVHVTADEITPAWSYSVGAFDTGCRAEIILVGLESDLAHSVANTAINCMREGIDLSVGRHSGVLEGVECIFRPVMQKWPEHLMHWTNWFYGKTPYPVLQCVYPDLAGLFPWEEGFNESWRSRQPLLFQGAEETLVEKDFWSANDPESSLFNWKFPDLPHTRVFVSNRISLNTEPITYVSHDHGEGDWQFHGDSMSEGKPPEILCFHCIVDRDPSIVELADLPIGWYAERKEPGTPWVRSELDPDEEEDEEVV